jgi:hypothetical protein
MSGKYRSCVRIVLFVVIVFHATEAAVAPALAGGHRARRTGGTVVVTRARPVGAPSTNTTLGIFRPTPYIMVRGDFPVGGGYSPVGFGGDGSMALYGPFSPLRATTASVLTYVRGYDGQIRLTEATAFSYPNLPALSPVIYPTEASNYYAPRLNRNPPSRASAINWIDQN